eukprot:scaffold96230_cov35-Phaeocystis_antarctica.AAC.2
MGSSISVSNSVSIRIGMSVGARVRVARAACPVAPAQMERRGRRATAAAPAGRRGGRAWPWSERRKSITCRSSSTARVVAQDSTYYGAAPETAESPDELAPSWRSSEKCAASPASGRWQLSMGRTAVLITSVSRWREARSTRPCRSAECTTQLRLAASGTGRSRRPGRQKSSDRGGMEMGSAARWLALVLLRSSTDTPARLAAARPLSWVRVRVGARVRVRARPLSSGRGGGGGAAETNSSKAASNASTPSIISNASMLRLCGGALWWPARGRKDLPTAAPGRKDTVFMGSTPPETSPSSASDRPLCSSKPSPPSPPPPPPPWG